LSNDLKVSKNHADWQLDERLYANLAHCKLKPGTINMSPGWFAQAHEVRWPDIPQENLLIPKQGPNHKLVVLPPLQNNGNGLKWLEANSKIYTLIGGILMILQPELFRIGCKALDELATNPYHVNNVQHLPAVLHNWNLPFNGIAIISNCTTPLH